MITLRSLQTNARKMLEKYLHTMIVGRPMIFEIRPAHKKRSSSARLSQARAKNSVLNNDGAFGGVVMNIMLSLQGDEILRPKNGWLHACDIRNPSGVAALKKIINHQAVKRTAKGEKLNSLNNKPGV
jgi:hypothetical protein